MVTASQLCTHAHIGYQIKPRLRAWLKKQGLVPDKRGRYSSKATKLMPQFVAEYKASSSHPGAVGKPQSRAINKATKQLTLPLKEVPTPTPTAAQAFGALHTRLERIEQAQQVLKASVEELLAIWR